jgi:hypothetical protein
MSDDKKSTDPGLSLLSEKLLGGTKHNLRASAMALGGAGMKEAAN